MKRFYSSWSLAVLLFVVFEFLFQCPVVLSRGGELAAYDETQVPAPRQDVCDRYDAVRGGTLSMRDALRGLSLRPVLRVGKYFHYDNVTGIDAEDPGFMATLLDELARRAGFTWRQSFGVTYGLQNRSMTFTDLLVWTVENYDLSVNWWDQSLERLERGVTFLRPWFDGSLILIEKQQPDTVDKDTVKFLNWLRPFTPNVWWVTIFTILTSALTYQWIENLGGQRNNRNYWQWFSDNVYLSAINFPQNYEFQPQTTAGRIFGVSISIWALVMTATYTANLASLLVDKKQATIRVESMDDVRALGIPICTYANTGMDAYIKQRYPNAKRIPLPSEVETYSALHEGRCALTVAYYQNWLGYAMNKTYNPYCDLEWVGRTIQTIQSGFAVSASHYCSSLIRDVLNIYIEELISSEYLEELWQSEYEKTQDINCDEIRPEVLEQQQQQQQQEELSKSAGRRRILRQMLQEKQLNHQQTQQRQQQSLSSSSSSSSFPYISNNNYNNNNSPRQRQLKAGGRGAAAVGGLSDNGDVNEEERLTLNQMAGTFVLHYALSALAIVVGYLGRYYKEAPRLARISFHGLSKNFRRRVPPTPAQLPDSEGPTIQSHLHHPTTTDDDNTGMDPSSNTEWKNERDSFRTAFADDNDMMNNRSNASNDGDMDYPQVHHHFRDDIGTKHHHQHNNETLTDDTMRMSLVSTEAWQQTQRELQETKRELQATRREMGQQMELIVSMLTDLQQHQQQEKCTKVA